MMADNAPEKPAAASPGILSRVRDFVVDVVNNPMAVIGNALTSPLRLISSLGRGVWENTVGNLFGVLTSGAVISGVTAFAPDLVRALPITVGGKRVGDVMADSLQKGGLPGMIVNSLVAGTIVNGAIGGIGSTLGTATASLAESNSGAKTTGSVIGGLATLAGVALIANKALGDHGIGLAPANTPPAPRTDDKKPQIS